MADSPATRYGPVVADPQRNRTRLAQCVFTLFSLLFVSGGIASGYVFVARASTVLERALMPAETSTPAPGRTPTTARAGSVVNQVPKPSPPTPASSSVVPVATSTPEPELDPEPVGQDRINILLLGVDQRPDEAGQPTRTDTMLVITIDPVGQSAGILSIPRDLWVPIPLDDRKPIQDRINTAHFYGDFYQFPGGGPALAKKTVQYNLGIRIQYYAKVDFPAFRRIVDTLGGVDVDVPSTLVDNEYPTDNYGFQRVYIPAGCQHLNGDLALKYARSRHMDSDFGRMRRQQAVLLAIRKRALNLNVLPRLPQLALEFAGAIKSDLPLSEILTLARVGKEIDASAITTRSIEGSAVQGIVTSGGADVMLPMRSEIQKLVAEIFSPRTAVATPALATTPAPAATSVRQSPPPPPTRTPTAVRSACG